MKNKDKYILAEEGLLSDFYKKNIFLKDYNYSKSIDLMEKGYSQTKIYYDIINKNQENKQKNTINIKNFLFTFIHKLN